MPAMATRTKSRELRALVSAIRSSWTEEERERRRKIGEARQVWLLGMLQQASETNRVAS